MEFERKLPTEATSNGAWNGRTALAPALPLLLGLDDIANGVAQVKQLRRRHPGGHPLLPYPVRGESILAFKLFPPTAGAEELRARLVRRHLRRSLR